MFVYFNWNNGDVLAAAFSEPERAAVHVIEKIEEYIGIRKKKAEAKVSKKKTPYVRNNEVALEEHVANLRQQLQEHMPQPIYGGGGGGGGIVEPLPWQVVMPEEQAIVQPPAPYPAQLPPPLFVDFAFNAPQAADPEADDGPYVPSMARKKAKKRSLDGAESPEFTALIKHLEIANKDATVENARKAIELYDAYVKFVLGTEPLLHTFQEIKVDDGSF